MKTAGAAALVALLVSACTIEDHPFGVSVDAGPGQIIVNPVAPTIAEGQSAVIAVHVENPPSGDVMVDCETANAAELTASPEILFFNDANASTPQMVTLTALQDADVADNQLSVICAAGNFENGLVNVIIVDDDLQTILVTPSGNPPIDVNEGSSVVVQVRLSARPTGVTSVTASANSSKITVLPSALTFSVGDWSSPKTLMVSGVEDTDTADESATVTVGSTGVPAVTLAFNVNDND